MTGVRREFTQQSQHTFAAQTASLEPDQVRQYTAQNSSQQDPGEAQVARASQRSARKQEKKGGNRKAELARKNRDKQNRIGRVYEVVTHLNLTLPARSPLTLLRRQMRA